MASKCNNFGRNPFVRSIPEHPNSFIFRLNFEIVLGLGAANTLKKESNKIAYPKIDQ